MGNITAKAASLLCVRLTSLVYCIRYFSSVNPALYVIETCICTNKTDRMIAAQHDLLHLTCQKSPAVPAAGDRTGTVVDKPLAFVLSYSAEPQKMSHCTLQRILLGWLVHNH